MCVFLGLEFDVLILSTVRTYSDLTIYDEQTGKQLGFLSNPKLLNTAITRARYQVILIGEPVALCSIGECKACWKTILKMCDSNKTFFYNRLSYEKLFEVVQDLQHEGTAGESSMSEGARLLSDCIEEKTGEIGVDALSTSDDNSSDKTDHFTSNSCDDILSNRRDDVSSISSEDMSSTMKTPVSSNSPPPPYAVTDSTTPAYRPTEGYRMPDFAVRPLFYGPRFNHGPQWRFNTPFGHHQYITHRGMQPLGIHASCEGHFMNHQFSPYAPRPFIQMCPVRPRLLLNHHNMVFGGGGYPCFDGQYAHPFCSGSGTVEFQSKHLLPDAKNLVNLRQKTQFVQEYGLYLLGNINASSDVKDLVCLNTKDAFKQLNKLSENHEVYEPIYLKIKTDEIESSVENIYVFVENQFIEYTRINQASDHSFPNRILFHKYEILKKQVSEMNSFISHEINYAGKSIELKKDLNSLSYLLYLLDDQVKTCKTLMNAQPVNSLLTPKLEFIDQQIIVAEANREQVEHRLAVEKVERLDDKNSKTLTNDGYSVELPTNVILDCEIGAIENSLAGASLESHDPDLIEWFSKRRNDPYVQEYITSHCRQFADRLPSPPPPLQDKLLASSGSNSRGRRYCNRNENVSQEPSFCVKRATGGKYGHKSDNLDDETCDYSISPSYCDYLEADYLRSLPGAHDGIIKYVPTEDYDQVHGTVFVNNSLQVHINGLKFNNRALPGDSVIVKSKHSHDVNMFDVSGKVFCVTQRLSKVFSCRKISNDLVIPIGDYGPPILMVRGIGTENRTLDPTKIYDVKIIDWPLNMKYPLGEIVKISDISDT